MEVFKNSILKPEDIFKHFAMITIRIINKKYFKYEGLECEGDSVDFLKPLKRGIKGAKVGIVPLTLRVKYNDVCNCVMFLQDDCQNYIRVLAKIAEDKVLICGTNAYKPLCRHYHLKVGPC